MKHGKNIMENDKSDPKETWLVSPKVIATQSLGTELKGETEVLKSSMVVEEHVNVNHTGELTEKSYERVEETQSAMFESEETQTMGTDVEEETVGSINPEISYHYDHQEDKKKREEKVILKYIDHMINEDEVVDDKDFKRKRINSRGIDLRKWISVCVILVIVLIILVSAGLFLRTEKINKSYTTSYTYDNS